MFIRATKVDLTGCYYCTTCSSSLQREDKLIGFIQQTAHDVYRCPRCSLLHWVPRPPKTRRVAS